MITARRIEQLAAHGEHERLLEEVLRNGRDLPIQARLRLFSEEALAASSLGLALQRHVELSRVATPGAARVESSLVASQRPDGGFGGVASTSIAIRGLRMAEQAPGAVAAAELAIPLDRAMEWLHRRIERSRLTPDASQSLDDLDAAIILWQLCDDERAPTMLPLHAMAHELFGRVESLDPATRSVLALASGEAPPSRLAA